MECVLSLWLNLVSRNFARFYVDIWLYFIKVLWVGIMLKSPTLKICTTGYTSNVYSMLKLFLNNNRQVLVLNFFPFLLSSKLDSNYSRIRRPSKYFFFSFLFHFFSLLFFSFLCSRLQGHYLACKRHVSKNGVHKPCLSFSFIWKKLP